MPLRCGTRAHPLQWRRTSRSCNGFIRAQPMRSLSSSATVTETILSHDSGQTAIWDRASGTAASYRQLRHDVHLACQGLQGPWAPRPVAAQRVAMLCEPSYAYVVLLLAIMHAGAVAFPLAPGYPVAESRSLLDDALPVGIVASDSLQVKASQLSVGTSEETCFPGKGYSDLIAHALDHSSADLPSRSSTGGLMLYTSGTTSRPKGVILSQSNLLAQVRSLCAAWQYSAEDRLLHVLPLYHIHGIVNALLTPLYAGATVELLHPFTAQGVWSRFAAPFRDKNGDSAAISFFAAVPTVYHRLLTAFDGLDAPTKEAATKAISPKHLRLNISGSAALPTPTKHAWTRLSGGNALLERYGMTEVGMALSCGMRMEDRVDGSVGWPLPGVQVRLVESDTSEVIAEGQELDSNGNARVGEIQLRGPTVFESYWHNPAATAKEFVAAEDGGLPWFKTGDVATRYRVSGAGESASSWARGPMYFIQGRQSVDIIKTGGEKVSALEIERELLALPQIAEAAVVGLPSEQWGQKVAAIVVLHPEPKSTGRGGRSWGVMDLRRALKDKLVSYKIPQELKIVEDALPRNAMGKVNKKDLVQNLFSST